MTRKPSPNPKSAVAHVDRILLNVKRMASDVASLREEIRTLNLVVATDRELDTVKQRLYLIRRQQWNTNDLLHEFDEAFDAAIGLARKPGQLRLTGGR